MKFGRRLLRETQPHFRHYYIAYKDLKKAVKVITGTEPSTYSIREVTNNFGNAPAFAGGVFRPSESRLQDLLNAEKEKINKFMEVTLSAVNGALKNLLKEISRLEENTNAKTIEELETALDEQAEQILFLESYRDLNFTGFRKITKKYDKQSKSNSSAWYMAQLQNELFMNPDFESPMTILSVCYQFLRERKIQVASTGMTPPALPPVQEEDSGNFPAVKQLSTTGTKDQFASAVSSATSDVLAAGAGSCENHAEELDLATSKFLLRPECSMKLKLLLLKYLPLVGLGTENIKPQDVLDKWLDPLVMMSAHRLDHQTQSTRQISHCCAYLDNDTFDTYRTLLGNETTLTSKMDSATTSSSVKVPTSFRRSSQPHRGSIVSGKPTTSTKQNLVIRFRWIGENNGEDEKDIFIERVSFAEIANSSNEWPDVIPDNALGNVNQCVSVRQKHIGTILQGTFDVESWLLRKNYPEARASIIRDFLNGVMSSIKAESLKPMLQFWYYRCSFRCETPCKNVFVNLDERMRFISEIDSAGTSIYKHKKYWSIPFTAALAEEDVEALPYVVLSVSYPSSLHPASRFPLNSQTDSSNESETPAKLQINNICNLLQMISELPTVTEVWEFTPFVHGMAHIATKLRGLEIQLPHWYVLVVGSGDNDPSRIESGQDNKDESEDEEDCGGPSMLDSTQRRASGMNVDIIKNHPGSKFLMETDDDLQLVGSSRGRFSKQYDSLPTGSLPSGIPTKRHALSSSPAMPPPRYLDGAPPPEAQFGAMPTPLAQMSCQNAAPTAVAPLDDLARPLLNDRSLMWRSDSMGHTGQCSTLCNRVRKGLASSVVVCWSPMNCVSKLLSSERPATPLDKTISAAVRVEPKAFFANERTLLQWMNIAVLLATLAISLLNFGNTTGRLGGFVMAPVAIFFLIYSFAVYLRRNRALERKEAIQYSDTWGPALLVLTLVFAVSSVVILTVLSGQSEIAIPSLIPSPSNVNLRTSRPTP